MVAKNGYQIVKRRLVERESEVVTLKAKLNNLMPNEERWKVIITINDSSLWWKNMTRDSANRKMKELVDVGLAEYIKMEEWKP